MDLPQVKAVVKVWEKAFKAKNKREPTKEDIKKDTSGIAEHYALYRKLAKAAAGANGSQPPSSSASASTSASGAVASGSQRTPRIVPNAEYPTTPTPPARRSYVQRPAGSSTLGAGTAEAGPSRSSLPSAVGPAAEAARNLKRTASKADLGLTSPTTSTSLNTFLTPRKPKFKPDASPAYTGPVLDPNPLNPFLASPSRPRISPFGPKATSSTPYTMEPSGSGNSPFIHASSPRKLKEVLEANSLRKVRARMESSSGAGASPSKSTAITPRTRARKRLRGEVVDDTPGKPAPGPRRKRGQRDEVELPKVGKQAMMREDDSDGDEDEQMADITRDILGDEMGVVQEEEEDEDDGMGPSPLKPMDGGRVFTTFSDVPEPPARAGSQSLKAKLSAASANAPILANGKGKGKAKVGQGIKEDGRQMKMNTFFQRSDRVPKRPATTEPGTTNGSNGRPPYPAPIASSSSSSQPKSSRPKPTQSNGRPSVPPSLPIDPISQTPLESDPTPIPESWDSPPPLDSSSDPIERLPTPPPDPELEAAALTTLTPSRRESPQQRKVKRITQSSDDDEAGPCSLEGEMEIVIVPTRREVDPRFRRAGSLDSLGSVHDDDEQANGEIEEEDLPDGEEEDEFSPPSPSLPPHLLSLLSLRSPSKPKSSRQKSELVVKALFDPEAARRLKALQRGQDVRVGGVDVEDLGAEGEEDELERFENRDVEDGGDEGEVYGDDDWEEEDEGWKRPGEDMDEGW